MKRKDGFLGERALVLPPAIVHEMNKDHLASPLFITDIGFYPKAKYHHRERLDPISQYILIYCIEGKGWYEIESTRHNISDNQFFIIPANKKHQYASAKENPWTIYWVHFNGKLAAGLSESLDVTTNVTPSVNSRINERISLFEEIFQTLEMGYSYENLLYANYTFLHFLTTLRFLQQYRNAQKKDDNLHDMTTVGIHFMKENIQKKLTLDDMANHLGYSTSHFAQVFSAHTGYSPIKYFNQLKIQQACHYLDFTNIKINQICYKVGIDDCYYFSRLFKQIMGISPREYQKRKKG